MKLEIHCPQCGQTIAQLRPTMTSEQIFTRVRYAFRLHWKRSVRCRRAEDTKP